MKADEGNVLEYHVPERSRKLKTRWIICSILNAFSLLICVAISFIVVEAFTYKGAENYAKLALLFLGVPALLIQGVLATYALILCIRDQHEQFTTWDIRLRRVILITAAIPVLLEFAIFAYYAR